MMAARSPLTIVISSGSEIFGREVRALMSTFFCRKHSITDFPRLPVPPVTNTCFIKAYMLSYKNDCALHLWQNISFESNNINIDSCRLRLAVEFSVPGNSGARNMVDKPTPTVEYIDFSVQTDVEIRN